MDDIEILTFVIIGAAAVAGIAVFAYVLVRNRRVDRDRTARIAMFAGERRYITDPLSPAIAGQVTSMAPFKRGRKHQFINQFAGEIGGEPFQFTDVKMTVGYGKHQHSERASVLLLPLRSKLPPFTVAKRTFVTWLSKLLHHNQVLIPGQDSFNQKFVLTTRDAAVADLLSDGRTIASLMLLCGFSNRKIMIDGTVLVVVVAGTRLSHDRLPDFLDAAAALRQRLESGPPKLAFREAPRLADSQ